jgi:hypothetical protein
MPERQQPELQYLLYGLDKTTEPWGYELQMGAKQLERLLPSQAALCKDGEAAVLVQYADSPVEYPERLTYAQFSHMPMVSTEHWPQRFDEHCERCNLPIAQGQPWIASGNGTEHWTTQGCQEAREAADGTYYVTTATADADGFGTHTVELLPYRTRGGMQYRRVWIRTDNKDWQLMRNASCGALTVMDTEKERADLESLVEAGLVQRIGTEQEVTEQSE